MVGLVFSSQTLGRRLGCRGSENGGKGEDGAREVD